MAAIIAALPFVLLLVAYHELPRIPVMRSSRSFGPSGHSGCYLSGITWKSHMLTPKVDQHATLRTDASADRAVLFLSAFGADVGCRCGWQSDQSGLLLSPKPFSFICERGVLVKVLIGQMDNNVNSGGIIRALICRAATWANLRLKCQRPRRYSVAIAMSVQLISH